MTYTTGRCPGRTLAGRSGRIARLIRVPLGLAVVAELHVATRPLAAYPRAGSTATGNDGIAAVRSRAPPGVRIGQQHSPDHEVFVFGYGSGERFQQRLNVSRVHRFRTLRAADVRAAFGDFDHQVVLQAAPAGVVFAVEQRVELVAGRQIVVAEGALLGRFGGCRRRSSAGTGPGRALTVQTIGRLMTIWREFGGGGASVQIAWRVGRMLRSGIKIVLKKKKEKMTVRTTHTLTIEMNFSPKLEHLAYIARILDYPVRLL